MVLTSFAQKSIFSVTVFWIILGTATLGLIDSTYLTITHYTRTQVACTNNSFINCQDVTNSAFSYVPKTTIPVSMLGIIWFLGTIILTLMTCFPNTLLTKQRLWQLELLWLSAGLAFVAYFVFTELVRLHKICEWCTFVHIMTITAFCAAVFSQKKLEE